MVVGDLVKDLLHELIGDEVLVVLSILNWSIIVIDLSVPHYNRLRVTEVYVFLRPHGVGKTFVQLFNVNVYVLLRFVLFLFIILRCAYVDI